MLDRQGPGNGARSDRGAARSVRAALSRGALHARSTVQKAIVTGELPAAAIPGLAILAGLLFAAVQPARATCGSASCFLVTETTQGVGLKGNLRADLSFGYVNQDRMLSGRDEVDEVLTPKIDFENEEIEPDHHREIRTQNTQLQLNLAYGLTDRWTISTLLPLVNQKDHEHFDDVGTPEEHFTGEDGTSGFGDMQLGARYAIVQKTKDLLVGGLTLKLPTGAHTLRDGEGSVNEPTLQPGTGSIDGIAFLQYAHQIIPLRFEWFVSGTYRLNTENDLDYRIGDESRIDTGVAYQIANRWTWSIQANARRAARDEYLGDDVPSTGSTAVSITPGFRASAESGASFYLYVQLPVFQDVNESQLAPRAGILLGVAKNF